MAKRILVFLLSLFTIFHSYSGEGDWVQRYLLDDVLLSWDYEINIPTRTGQDAFEFEQHSGLVFLDYTRKEQSDLGWGNDWNIKVTYSYYMPDQTYSSPAELQISYENGNYVYSDYGLIPINLAAGQLGFTVKIDKIEGWYFDLGNWVYSANPQMDNTHFPDDIDLRFELRSKQYYQLNISSANAEAQRFYFDSQNYRAHWSYVEGAELYDFEWVWIDAYSKEYDYLQNLTSGNYWEEAFVLKEATRVRKHHTHHIIDQTYPEGTLYFRVRPVSYYEKEDGSGMYDQIKEGDWTYFYNDQLLTETYLVKHQINAQESFEPEKNWLYGVAYAEEGKSVSSLTYYDGSNRGRQSLTYNTSDDITLVGESKFDREGRQI